MVSRPTPTPAGARARRAVIIAATVLPVLAADAATKAWARAELADTSVQLAWLELRLGFNAGVAFGIGAGSPSWIVLTLTGALVAVLAVAAVHLRPPAAAGLLLGGGMANLIDRGGDGTVTDFLSIGWWPTFNLADSAIVVGAAWLVFAELRPSRRARTVERSGGPVDHLPATRTTTAPSSAEELQVADLPIPAPGADGADAPDRRRRGAHLMPGEPKEGPGRS